MIAGFHLQAQANTIQKGNVRFYFSFLKKLCIAFADREKRVFTNAAEINSFDTTILALPGVMPRPKFFPILLDQLLAVLVISRQKVSFGSPLTQWIVPPTTTFQEKSKERK